VRGSNPGLGEIFCTRPYRPWGPPSILYNEYQVSFPRIKRPERDLYHPPTLSAEVKESVELYLYSPLDLYGLFLGDLYRTFKVVLTVNNCSFVAICDTAECIMLNFLFYMSMILAFPLQSVDSHLGTKQLYFRPHISSTAWFSLAKQSYDLSL